MRLRRFALLHVAVPAILVALPCRAGDLCEPIAQEVSLGELVERVEREGIGYVFVGERHDVGPVKRFTSDLVNSLVDSGLDVGLYVEGYRVGCTPGDDSCWSLARAFNPEAFRSLLSSAQAPVHAIDPVERDGRAARMARVIAAGTEDVRVVLVGRSHVIHAGDDDAELWVYGGGMKFPDPGDLAEAFPRERVLTIGLEVEPGRLEPYALERSGCGLDYVLATSASHEFGGGRGP